MWMIDKQLNNLSKNTLDLPLRPISSPVFPISADDTNVCSNQNPQGHLCFNSTPSPVDTNRKMYVKLVTFSPSALVSSWAKPPSYPTWNSGSPPWVSLHFHSWFLQSVHRREKHKPAHESPMSTLHGHPVIFSIEPRLYHGLQGPPWTDSASRYNHISYHHPFTVYHLQLLTFCSSNMPSTFLSRIFFFPTSPHGTLPCFIFVWLTEVITLVRSQHKHHVLGEAVLDLPHSVSLTSPALFPSRKFSLFKIAFLGTSLVVQWLRLHFVRLWVQSLVREPRSHMPHGQKTRNNMVTNSIKTLTRGARTWGL